MTKDKHPTVDELNEHRAESRFHAKLADALNEAKQADTESELVELAETSRNAETEAAIRGQVVVYVRPSAAGLRLAGELVNDNGLWYVEPTSQEKLKIVRRAEVEK